MKKTLFTVAALVVFLASNPAKAGGIDFSALVGQTVSLTVMPYSSGENNGQYFVGLTEGIIGGQPFWMYCVDFSHEIGVPTTYDVVVEGLTPATFTSDSMGLSLADLQKQATLGLNFGTAPSGNVQKDIDAQEAIWNLSGASYAPDAGMAAMINAMLATYGARDYSGSFLLDSTTGGQDFMPVGSVPEPTTMALMGLGLLGIGATKRLYRK